MKKFVNMVSFCNAAVVGGGDSSSTVATNLSISCAYFLSKIFDLEKFEVVVCKECKQ